MRRYAAAIAAILVTMVWSVPGFAAKYYLEGKVVVLSVIAKDLAAGIPAHWFQLDNNGSAGTCARYETLNHVFFRIPADDDATLSAVLTAKASSRTLRVHVDDTRVDSGGYCILNYVRILG